MKNRIVAIRATVPLISVWVPTGNFRAPLACVWIEADIKSTCTASTSSANKDEEEGRRLCA
jgi:hypothetical protein